MVDMGQRVCQVSVQGRRKGQVYGADESRTRHTFVEEEHNDFGSNHDRDRSVRGT